MTTPPAEAAGARKSVVLVAPALEYSAPALYALTLASGLMARGLAVRVIAPGGRLEKSFRERGIPLSIEPNLERAIVGGFVLRRLTGELEDEDVLAVHAVSSTKIEAAAALARRLDAPVAATIHRHYEPGVSPETDWAPVGAIITFSEDLRADAVNRRRAPKERVRVIPAGIVAPEGGRRLPFDREGAVPIVGTLADVEKREAQMDFFHAAAEVLRRRPRVEFLVVAGGGEPRSLRHFAREIGVARAATFTTLLDTRKVLGIMDICVLPGAAEGPGQTILEAMAAGRPVITTGAGGAYDVIRDEESGLIVEKGDRSKLAAAIERLVADKDLARRLGAAAREVVLERFPLDRMLDETMAAYVNL